MKIKPAWLMLFAGIVPIIIVLSFYAWSFAFPSKFSLSNNSTEWANFGSYFSGLLSPILAWLAFFGIWISIRSQYSQIELSEIQRLVNTESQTLDRLLESKVEIENVNATPDTAKVDQENEKYFDVFKLISTGASCLLDNRQGVSSDLYISDLAKRLLSLSSMSVIWNLQTLVRALVIFKAIGGSKLVIGHYKFKYSRAAWGLHELDFPLPPSIIDFFEVEEYRKGLISAIREKNQ